MIIPHSKSQKLEVERIFVSKTTCDAFKERQNACGNGKPLRSY